MPEIKLTLDAGDAKTVAEALRADHVEWLAEIVEAQLPKAPVEEPTEWGSVVRARRSPAVPRTLLTYVPEPDEVRDSRYSWYSDQDSWHIWSDLSDVEVLRVGVGEQIGVPVEKVRALRKRAVTSFGGRLAGDSPERVAIREVLDGLGDLLPEPTPEQVEADLAQDEHAHARYYAQEPTS